MVFLVCVYLSKYLFKAEPMQLVYVFMFFFTSHLKVIITNKYVYILDSN